MLRSECEDAEMTHVGARKWLHRAMPFMVLTLAALLSCSAQSGTSDKLPEDAELERKFTARRGDLYKLLSMATGDGAVRQMSFDHFWIRDAQGNQRQGSERDLPEKRQAEYRKLFQTIGLPAGFTWESSQLFLPVKIVELNAVDSLEKGFAYLQKSPSAVLESLDNLDIGARRPHAAFKRLTGNWYIYARYNE
jgi:hypothetical protein